MSTSAKKAKESVASAGSVECKKGTSSNFKENQLQTSNELSPVPSKGQIHAIMALAASSAYALPSFSGYSTQRMLEKALEIFTHIDTEHCCCKHLYNYAVKLSAMYHNLLTAWPEVLALKDREPSDAHLQFSTKLRISMEKMDLPKLKHVLEYIKQSITFIGEHFHAFVDELCLDDAQIERTASVQMLEQIKAKLVSIDLKHRDSMKLVEEIEELINDILVVIGNFRIIIDDMRAKSDKTLDECLFEPLKTTQNLYNFTDRLGTDKKFFDAVVAHIQSSICSTSVEEIDLTSDESQATRIKPQMDDGEKVTVWYFDDVPMY